MTIRKMLCAPALVLVLGLAACGQGTTQPASAPATPATQGSAPTPVATAEPTPEGEATPTPAPTSAPSSSQPPATTMSANMSDWTLTTAGWGPVRMGFPLPPNLRGQLKPAWECIGPIIQDSRGNDRMEFWTGQPDGSGKITTLHIVDPSVSTRAGIRPGDSLAKVQQTYPSAKRFRAATDMTGDVYVLADDATGLFFEIKRGATTVEHISVQPLASFTAFQVQICGGP